MLIYLIIFLLAFALLGVIGPKLIKNTGQWEFLRSGMRFVAVVGVLFTLAATSFTRIGEDETGHLMKIYGWNSLKQGNIIAANGEKGPQAEVLPPGFHVRPLLNIIYDINKEKILEIPDGKLGFLVAKDGARLRAEQTYAEPFEEISNDPRRMIADAAFFINSGGQKGPQTSVLTPGRYRLNQYLWQVKILDATEIPEGFVGVIKANVHASVHYGNLKTERPESCVPIQEGHNNAARLANPVVPVGCIGVWEKALNPGRYYVNTEAYKVTLVNTRVQAWEYRGGYTSRHFDLTVDQKGVISQVESSTTVAVPKGAADEAIALKVEGWTVNQQVRVLVQVSPQNAPFVVASVGGLTEVEDRIMTPAVQSVLRNVVGGTIEAPTVLTDNMGNPVLDENTRAPQITVARRPTKVLDLIEHRDLIEAQVEPVVRSEGLKAWVDIKEVRLLHPDFPPELLVARKREQLADQLRKAYDEERIAQQARIEAERERATADQQDNLVTAQIQRARAAEIAMARKLEGQGEKDKLELIAQGQRAQVEVLGENRVVELRKFELVLDRVAGFFETNPEVLTVALQNAQKFVPERVFMTGSGNGSDLTSAMAVLGDLLSPDKTAKANPPVVPVSQ